MTTIKLSAAKQGVYGISGHVGVGHVHSHCGFVQDDSAGFAVAASLLQRAVPLDTTIAKVDVDLPSGSITITTAAGGQGTVAARRRFTPAESELAQKALDSIPKLRGCQIHCSSRLSKVDLNTLKKLGLQVTMEPTTEHF